MAASFSLEAFLVVGGGLDCLGTIFGGLFLLALCAFPIGLLRGFRGGFKGTSISRLGRFRRFRGNDPLGARLSCYVQGWGVEDIFYLP